MTSTTSAVVLSPAQAARLVSTFHTSRAAALKSQTALKTSFNTATRDAVYDNLEEAYGASLQLTASPEALGALCAHYGAKAPSEGENPHSATVRVLFRKKKANGKTEADKSAWKYSKGFRAAQALGWAASDYSKNLKKFELKVPGPKGEKTLRGHIALETYDSQQHGDPDKERAALVEVAAQRWLCQVETDLGTVNAAIPVENPEQGQMVSLVAQFDAKKGWLVRDVFGTSHEGAWNFIKKDVVTRFQAWRLEKMEVRAANDADKEVPSDIEQLLALLPAQNREVEAAEATHAITKAATTKSADA